MFLSTCRSTPVPGATVTTTVEPSVTTALPVASEASKPGQASPVPGTATPTTTASVVSQGMTAPIIPSFSLFVENGNDNLQF